MPRRGGEEEEEEEETAVGQVVCDSTRGGRGLSEGRKGSVWSIGEEGGSRGRGAAEIPETKEGKNEAGGAGKGVAKACIAPGVICRACKREMLSCW